MSREETISTSMTTEKDIESTLKACEDSKSVLDSLIPSNIVFYDYSNNLDVLERAYKLKKFCLIVGPHGSGKTTLVRKFAEKKGLPLYNINLSYGTAESHLIGRLDMQDGTVNFKPGIIPRAMRNGGILYLDELNSAKADVLLRLDEVLDIRRKLVLKEDSGIVIPADENFFVVATINPLDHKGTKEMPQQMNSRFPVRIHVEYPKSDVELKIIEQHVNINSKEEPEVVQAIKLANEIREQAKEKPGFYSPSIRETIMYAELVDQGTDPKRAAELVFKNLYAQWGRTEMRKIGDLIDARW